MIRPPLCNSHLLLSQGWPLYRCQSIVALSLRTCTWSYVAGGPTNWGAAVAVCVWDSIFPCTPVLWPADSINYLPTASRVGFELDSYSLSPSPSASASPSFSLCLTNTFPKDGGIPFTVDVTLTKNEGRSPHHCVCLVLYYSHHGSGEVQKMCSFMYVSSSC